MQECMRIGILFRTGCFLFLFIRLEKPAKPAFLIRCDSIFQLKLSYRPTKKVGVRLPFPFLARAKGSFSFYQKVRYLVSCRNRMSFSFDILSYQALVLARVEETVRELIGLRDCVRKELAPVLVKERV